MKPQIFFLHFAGGNRYSFKFIVPFLDGFDVHCLELPGRGMRMGEELITDFDKAVNDYVGQIIKLSGTNFAIFGHSMGAVLMLKLVDQIEKAGMMPFYVFTSGNPGPLTIERKGRHHLSKMDFKEELIKYGGMPQGVVDDVELYDFFEPVLRADFEVVDGCYNLEQPVIFSPIIAMMGKEEQGVEKIGTWQSYTRGRFAYRNFSGGHFFIYDNAKAIAELIKECYNASLSS